MTEIDAFWQANVSREESSNCCWRFDIPPYGRLGIPPKEAKDVDRDKRVGMVKARASVI